MFVDSDDWNLDTCEVAVHATQKYNADLAMWSYTREFENKSREKHMFWDDKTTFEQEEVSSQLHR